MHLSNFVNRHRYWVRLNVFIESDLSMRYMLLILLFSKEDENEIRYIVHGLMPWLLTCRLLQCRPDTDTVNQNLVRNVTSFQQYITRDL